MTINLLYVIISWGDFLELINTIIEFALHFDKHLDTIIAMFGMVTYLLLFLVIFSETGLVVCPFLPGDSLIFAAAAITARVNSPINIWVLFIVLVLAAVLGNTVNYLVGRKIGQRIYDSGKERFIKKKHIDKAILFYEKHGGMAVIFSRFVPFVRTFIPFVAGIGRMNFAKYSLYNIIGGFSWVSLMSILGYFFGNLPFVKNNFSFVAVAIILISLMPAVIIAIKEKTIQKKEK